MSDAPVITALPVPADAPWWLARIRLALGEFHIDSIAIAAVGRLKGIPPDGHGPDTQTLVLRNGDAPWYPALLLGALQIQQKEILDQLEYHPPEPE